MDTLVLQVDPRCPDPAAMAQASAVIRRGGLVAFPTETVYGLGANALDRAAVARIFTAKGRPSENPVIVHVGDATAARQLTTHWPDTADRLAERFWPGPLTLVLPSSGRIPALVTAGGPTVGLRVPAHPVALALLRACQLPLAAPSANRSTWLSPTSAAHVLNGLNGRLDVLLDAGPTSGGLESTVLDLTNSPPRLLRPGLVTPREIESIIGTIERSRPEGQTEPLKSPGLLDKHYAPHTLLECVAEDGGAHARRLLASGLRPGWLTYVALPPGSEAIPTIVLPDDLPSYAAGLYAALHELDAARLDRIVVALPPDSEEWLAVRDRLLRAAGSER